MSKKIFIPEAKPINSPDKPKPINEEKGRTSQKPSFLIKPKK